MQGFVEFSKEPQADLGLQLFLGHCCCCVLGLGGEWVGGLSSLCPEALHSVLYLGLCRVSTAFRPQLSSETQLCRSCCSGLGQ